MTTTVDDDEACDVCRFGDSVPGNLIVFCEGKCGLAFHQLCYGIREVPEGDTPWYCELCAGKVKPQPCSICHSPVDLQGLKGVTRGGTVFHPTCALAAPEIWCVNTRTLNSLRGGSRLVKQNKPCYFCKATHGSLISCCAPMCGAKFHPRCALNGGGRLQLSPYNIPKVAFCDKHIELYDVTQHRMMVKRRFSSATLKRKINDPRTPVRSPNRCKLSKSAEPVRYMASPLGMDSFLGAGVNNNPPSDSAFWCAVEDYFAPVATPAGSFFNTVVGIQRQLRDVRLCQSVACPNEDRAPPASTDTSWPCTCHDFKRFHLCRGRGAIKTDIMRMIQSGTWDPKHYRNQHIKAKLVICQRDQVKMVLRKPASPKENTPPQFHDNCFMIQLMSMPHNVTHDSTARYIGTMHEMAGPCPYNPQLTATVARIDGFRKQFAGLSYADLSVDVPALLKELEDFVLRGSFSAFFGRDSDDWAVVEEIVKRIGEQELVCFTEIQGAVLKFLRSFAVPYMMRSTKQVERVDALTPKTEEQPIRHSRLRRRRSTQGSGNQENKRDGNQLATSASVSRPKELAVAKFRPLLVSREPGSEVAFDLDSLEFQLKLQARSNDKILAFLTQEIASNHADNPQLFRDSVSRSSTAKGSARSKKRAKPTLPRMQSLNSTASECTESSISEESPPHKKGKWQTGGNLVNPNASHLSLTIKRNSTRDYSVVG